MTFVKCDGCNEVLFGHKPARHLRCGACESGDVTRLSPSEVGEDMFKETVDNQLHNWAPEYAEYSDDSMRCENCGEFGVWVDYYMEMVSGYKTNACSVDCLVEVVSTPD